MDSHVLINALLCVYRPAMLWTWTDHMTCTCTHGFASLIVRQSGSSLAAECTQLRIPAEEDRRLQRHIDTKTINSQVGSNQLLEVVKAKSKSLRREWYVN